MTCLSVCGLTCLSVPSDSSGPSSTVSSAGPSSPTTADTSPRFSFSDKISLTPQSSEETHTGQNMSAHPGSGGSQPPDPACTPPANHTQVPLTPNNSPEDDGELGADPSNLRPDASECVAADGGCPGPDFRVPCSALSELTLSRMEGFCGLPGSLPVLLELRESSSEAGSSSQTPQSPEGPDEFFDTQEELWSDGLEPRPDVEAAPEGGATHTSEP